MGRRKTSLPGGGRYDEVAARTDASSTARTSAGGDVAVAHGRVLRVLEARWVGEEPGAFEGHLALGTGAVSVLGFERDA
jgi:broad specificity phosphatase PhoE